MSQLLPPGTHAVRVVNTGFTGDDPQGRAQLTVYFEDDAGDHITWYSALGTLKDGGFSDKAFKFACDQLRCLGWDAEKNAYAFEALGEDSSPIRGVDCEIVVVEETYEGKTHTKVKWINDPNRRGGVERMAPEAAKSFGDRIRKHLGVKGPVTTGKPKPAAPVVPENCEKDKGCLSARGHAGECDIAPFLWMISLVLVTLSSMA